MRGPRLRYDQAACDFLLAPGTSAAWRRCALSDLTDPPDPSDVAAVPFVPGIAGQLFDAARTLRKRLARGTPPDAPDREPLFSYRRLGPGS